MKIYRLLLLLSSWAHKFTALNVAILLTCLIAVALVGYAVYLCRKEEKGLKLAACLMLWIGAVSLCAFQTHTFPALDTNNIWTGTNTFSLLNKRVTVDQLAGATAGAQIRACNSALPNGGICDATGYGATTQTIDAPTTLLGGITYLFDPNTKFQSATSGLNLFTFEEDTILDGFSFDCTNQPSYSGILFQTDTAGNYGYQGSPAYHSKTRLDNVTLLQSCGANSTGTALLLTSVDPLHGVSFVEFSDWRVRGFADGLRLNAIGGSGTGGTISGNFFNNFHCQESTTCVHFTGNTGPNPGTIYSNMFWGFSSEGAGIFRTGTNAILSDGNASVRNNQFYPAAIWDYLSTAPINWSSTSVANSVLGRIDHSSAIVDASPGNSNVTWDLVNQTLTAANTNAIFGILKGPVNLCDTIPCATNGTLRLNADSNLGVTTDGTNLYTLSKSQTYLESNGTIKNQFTNSGELWLLGYSGASAGIKLTGSPTALRTATFPDANITVTGTVGSGTGTTAGTAIGAGTSQTLAITVSGALVTDVATCSTSAAYPATWLTGITVLPPVVTANTVTLTITNPSAGSITPAAQTFRCTVTR